MDSFGSWKRIWSPWIPTKVSIFLWKVIHNCLPLDKKIKQSGIAICSKCRCCKDSREEDINHLFVGSELATKVWTYFQSRGISISGNTVRSLITRSILKEIGKSAFGLLSTGIVAYGLWEIWAARNAFIHDNKSICSNSLIQKILAQVKLLVHLSEL